MSVQSQALESDTTNKTQKDEIASERRCKIKELDDIHKSKRNQVIKIG